MPDASRTALSIPIVPSPEFSVVDAPRSARRLSQWLSTIVARLRSELVAPLIEAILPAECPGCDRSLPGLSRNGICERCWASLTPIVSPLCPRCGLGFPSPFDGGPSDDHLCRSCLDRPPAFDGARCALVYEGPVRAILHLFKFDHRSDFARPLARYAVASLPPAERFDLVVPVPLHWTRRVKRGYNQAALLARGISRARRVRVARRLLVKRRRTPDQAGLDAAARRRNLEAAFVVRLPWLPRIGAPLGRLVSFFSRSRATSALARSPGLSGWISSAAVLGPWSRPSGGSQSMAHLPTGGDRGDGQQGGSGHGSGRGSGGGSGSASVSASASGSRATLSRRLRPRGTAPLTGLRVLLVDDIVTTGATAEACARALKTAGAERVFVVAIARTPAPGSRSKDEPGQLVAREQGRVVGGGC